jgi:glycosyltransferase involved in cell wall biosynthesis
MREGETVLLVLESVFPQVGGGGAEAQVATLATCFGRMGVGAKILAPMVAHGPQVASERVRDLAVERIAYPKIPHFGALVLLLRLAWSLVRERDRYDVIHAHIGGNMAAVCSVMGRLLGRPVIVKLTGLTEMAGGILDPSAGLEARWRRRAIQRATALQATSSRIAALLKARGFAADRIHLIPNAVDIERFRPAETRSRNAGPVVVYVGRLAREKALDLLLRAWAKARVDAGVLVLVGGGELAGELKRLASELGCGDSVRFTGPSSDVTAILQGADLAVLASGQEGLSNSLLEYMAAGLPVIGSRVSGTEDFVIPGRTGWLFEAGDVDGLARCLGDALATGAEQRADMARQARTEVCARASTEAVAKRLLDLYELSAQHLRRQRTRSA